MPIKLSKRLREKLRGKLKSRLKTARKGVIVISRPGKKGMKRRRTVIAFAVSKRR